MSDSETIEKMLSVPEARIANLEQELHAVRLQVCEIRDRLIGTMNKPGFFANYDNHIAICDGRFKSLESCKPGCAALSTKTIAALLAVAASVGGALVELVRYIIK